MKLIDEVAEAGKIVGFCTGAAVVYGLIHDQFTAHICVEYFSVAHPRLIDTQSPFLLGLVWGVVATWWVGLPLGVGLVLAARVGGAPRLRLADLKGAIVKLMICTGILAALSGAIGGVLVAHGLTRVPGGWDQVIAPSRHVVFSIDAWAHSASYLVGIVGGLVVILGTVYRRVPRT